MWHALSAFSADTPDHSFWYLFTRLGEAQILLPAALGFSWWLARRAEARPLVQWWLSLLALAILITTATKVAFIGWGIGNAALDFTGVSGHAMFAAAVYPLLAAALAASSTPPWRRLALAGGVALALLIGVSRLIVHSHSVSEVLAGLALGGTTSAVALALAHAPHTRVPLLLPIGLALWLSVTPASAPSSPTHGLVTRLALALSGHSQPHTRSQMHRAYRLKQQQQASADAAATTR
ncbi:phosphatase PAP2 family protein [Piscinibacter sp.]|jgi:membrane-associated phospholipid phosphatase|uniref:phosphatase PAP2 family protein n=1 Tax=Piscinibacter sp. TaxID=1903157 RepID=UPI00355A4CE9